MFEDPDVLSLVNIEETASILPTIDMEFDEFPEYLWYNKTIMENTYDSSCGWRSGPQFNRDNLDTYDWLCETFVPEAVCNPSKRIQAILRMRELPLEYANLEAKYRNDMEVTDAAWKSNPRILNSASARIQIAFQMRENAANFHDLPSNMKNDQDVALEAVVRDPSIMKSLSANLRKDRNFAW